jgi:hypothetical protein
MLRYRLNKGTMEGITPTAIILALGLPSCTLRESVVSDECSAFDTTMIFTLLCSTDHSAPNSSRNPQVTTGSLFELLADLAIFPPPILKHTRKNDFKAIIFNPKVFSVALIA